MVMQDTCEVDPTKLDDYDQDDLLSINAIQLTLLVQRFTKQIFQSSKDVPEEIREIMVEINNTVGLMHPESVQCSMSAFLFLSFYNCAIAIPESYGLLDEAPNERVRRSLVLATNIMTTMSSGSRFGDEEPFMAQFNDIIRKNQKELSKFYNSVCNGSGVSSEFTDTPSDVYANSMAVIAAEEKELEEQREKKKRKKEKERMEEKEEKIQGKNHTKL